jgi:hypothetical protein
VAAVFAFGLSSEKPIGDVSEFEIKTPELKAAGGHA